MIIDTLFGIFSNIALWALDLINLPDMPTQVISVLDSVKTYMVSGANIMAIFVNMKIFTVLATLTIEIILARELYLFVMWILNKIPIIDID